MITHVRRLTVAALSGAVLLVGAFASAGSAASFALPPANGQFDYQIGGAYTPSSSVQIVDRDRLEAPAAGKYNICYVNAFQTQPGDADWWKTNHNDLLLKKANGSYVVDSAWNEMLLDTSTAAKRTALLAIVGGWIDGCKASGYSAIEPDNLDSYDRSGKRLTKQNNIDFAKLLATRAHADGLAIAQKNDSSMAANGKAIGFDFAVVEECQVYGECGEFTDVYGAQVYEIEYTDNGGTSNFNKACTARGATTSVIYRDRDVVAKGASGYVYKFC
ncbi:endo alpha-1,4 polygalactosaminidase [Cellulomonas sp. URHE0023]|uniref:endo alpha-1,4 polygalactosaminidase n=1 Tax=Cellulomonas sp. URHE0023 TaxID=1380354 RepID=UPI00048130E5|nr:endo alpha-1,4 polygalactosaminidase [Cellulomonas sp. URHE0023]